MKRKRKPEQLELAAQLELPLAGPGASPLWSAVEAFPDKVVAAQKARKKKVLRKMRQPSLFYGQEESDD